MKIYPSQLYHRPEFIMEKNIDDNLTIPLAYLNNDNTKYIISRSIHEDFSKTITNEMPVLPYQEIENPDVLLFNKYGDPVDSTNIINRLDEKYCYHPNNMIEFTPLKFKYNVTAKRKISYSISKNFNINVTCLDDENTLDFLNIISKIMVAPSEKGFLPNNIHINKNSTNLKDLTTIDYDKTNFVFISSLDGLYYDFQIPSDPYEDEESKDYIASGNTIPYETFLDNNINTWVVSDEHYKYTLARGYGDSVSIKRPILTSDNTVVVRDFFNVEQPVFKNVKVHNLFETSVCPILIIEHPNRGFNIISSSEMFKANTIEKYKHIIYEVLMYVYCNSYKKSKYTEEYITYTLPDYEVINNKLERKVDFISKISLNDLLRIETNEYLITDINIIDNNKDLPVPDVDLYSTVECITHNGISNNKMKFKIIDTESVYKEPVKPIGWSSIYYNDKIYYIDQVLYIMESNIGTEEFTTENKLYLIEKGNDLLVRLYPFKSSKHGICSVGDVRVTIPSVKVNVNGVTKSVRENYMLYYDKQTKTLAYEYESEFKEESYKVKLAIISIYEERSQDDLTDMRIKGGGLPEDMPDNFNLLDIGHIYGRPYRQANTLVFTLPKKYEQYKNEILEVINKYKVAEDYTILFFEDEEDGE